MNVVVGVADCRISKDAGDVLITYALGSCIAVLIHDPIACVGGLLHFMLPASSSEALKSGKSPYMFADTGISLLFRQAYQAGAEKNRLRVGVAGGAQMIDGMDSFQIGKRNSLAARRILWRAGVMVHREEVGGRYPRTVSVNVGSGRLCLGSPELPGDGELA